MIQERIGQAALRSYPPAVRQTRGPEMLGMLLDAGEQSGRAFVRESGSLVLGGLRERRVIATRAGTRRLIADSCCQAVLIWLTLWLLSALNTAALPSPSQRLLIQQVVPAAILACALIGHERVAALGGLAAIAAFSPLGLHTQLVLAAKLLVLIACLLVMVRAPRQRSRDPRRLLWLLPVAVLAALQSHVHLRLPEVLAVVSVCGVFRLFYDPRLAVACALVWVVLLSTHASRSPAGLALLVIPAAVAAGLMLTVAARSLWITRHDAPG